MVEPSGFSGICQYSYCLSDALAAAGHEVSLITSPRYEMAQEPHRFTVVKLYDWLSGAIDNQGWWRHGWFRRPVRGSRYLVASLSVARWVMRHRPDVIHFQLMRIADFPTACLLKLLGVRVVYTAHEVAPDRSARWALDFLYYRFIYGLADRLIVHSEGDREKLSKVFRIRPGKIDVAPLGNYMFFTRSEGGDAAAARRKLGLPADAKVVLFFGVLRPNKGLDQLIEAFAEVARAEPRARLLVASYVKRGVADFTPYAAEIARLGLVKQVDLHLGYIPNEEVPEYFLASDVVALPYTSSHNSGVVQVAYAFGRPVVASNVGSFMQVVEEGRTGHVVAARQPRALARALLQLLGDAEAARRMGDHARELARTRYGWDRIAALTLEAYGRTANGNGRR